VTLDHKTSHTGIFVAIATIHCMCQNTYVTLRRLWGKIYVLFMCVCARRERKSSKAATQKSDLLDCFFSQTLCLYRTSSQNWNFKSVILPQGSELHSQAKLYLSLNMLKMLHCLNVMINSDTTHLAATFEWKG